MREYGGTCTLWHCSLNPMIRKLPETNSRIKAVELKCQTVLLCLVNVYLPARGTSANEMLLAECLDELHEIFVKYSLSHTLVVGGDFNASSHHGEGIRRDVLFLKFVHERKFIPDRLVCPSKMPFQSVVRIPKMHHLNLSDHTHVKTCISGVSIEHRESSDGKDAETKCFPYPRIRWNKCDLDAYQTIVSESLTYTCTLSSVECSLEPELLVKSITTTLRNALEAECPEPKKRKSAKGLPVWNDRIARAVHHSREAHVL